MRQLKTTNYTNCTNWLRRSWRVLLLLAIFTFQLSIVNSVKAQQENAAFYIYQNDGHFDGFFYDEVQKISYSVLDTLGIEHDEIVSQEIVTADSTYRIMLTAIDSVSFVQPEIRFNPRLRNVKSDEIGNYILKRNGINITLVPNIPSHLIPQVGDVLVDFDIEDSWGGKVKNVEQGTGWVYVECDSISDISDIFTQFVTVEQIDKNRNGNLIRRRVAGMPSMTVGDFPRRAEEGGFEGNIFNFTLSRHLPIYTSPSGDVNISIDPNLSAALSVKASWNLPLWGEKYISVIQNLDLALSMGFTIDGKIADVFPAEINQFGKMPLPAAAPILVLDFGPDGFLRGEWHGKFSGETPKAKGRIWQKWEIRNWMPSYSLGFGKTKEEQEKEEAEEPNTESLTFEFNGFVQTGLKFPLVLRNNALLDKVFKAQLGGTMYIGPKVSGAITFDVENWIDEGFDVYRTMKDSKLSISPISADYEIKANVKTLLTSQREWTMMDGSMSLFKDIDLFFFPEFKDIEIYEKVDGFAKQTFAIATPTRNVVWPLKVGLALYKKKGNAETLVHEKWHDKSYYQFSAWMESKEKLDYPNLYLNSLSGKYVIYPIFQFLGKTIKAEPSYEYLAPGAYIDLSMEKDTVTAEAENGVAKILFETNCDSVYLHMSDMYLDTCIIKKVSAEKYMAEIHLKNYYHFHQPSIFKGELRGIKDGESGGATRFYIQQQPNYTMLPKRLFIQVGSEDSNSHRISYEFNSNQNYSTEFPLFSAVRQGDMIHVTASYSGTYNKFTWVDGERVYYTGTRTWSVSFDINTNHPDYQADPDNPQNPHKYVVENSSAECSDTYIIKEKEYKNNISYNFDGMLLDSHSRDYDYKANISYDGHHNDMRYSGVFSGNSLSGEGYCNLSLYFSSDY